MNINDILPSTSLKKVNDVWTLYFETKEYARLLDAASREDAETQIAQMLFAKVSGASQSQGDGNTSVDGGSIAPDR